MDEQANYLESPSALSQSWCLEKMLRKQAQEPEFFRISASRSPADQVSVILDTKNASDGTSVGDKSL
jgi:hypothetical protein